jgi:DNA-binding transcriptional ArsR family regulator
VTAEMSSLGMTGFARYVALLKGATDMADSLMRGATDMAEIAALIGDPSRANILVALLDGRALTATELAYAAGVTPQTTSGHLARLTEAHLLAVASQGRHRYYRLASARVAQMLEAVMSVAALELPPRRRPPSRGDDALRAARTCYDHLAGHLGVALADALAGHGHLVLTEDGGEVTELGADFLGGFGIDLSGAGRRRRAFCRPCLDWTERRAHLGGALGAALTQRCFDLGWVARRRAGRAIAITRLGQRGFADTFAIDAPAAALAR